MFLDYFQSNMRHPWIYKLFLVYRYSEKSLRKTESQKETYKNEREELLCSIIALRQNIWDDGLLTSSIQDKLQSKYTNFK
mgnify:CR=1 FL=1